MKQRYSKYVDGIGINADGTTFAGPDLIADILDDRNSFARIASDLEKQFQRRLVEAENDYKEFVRVHGANTKSMMSNTISAASAVNQVPTIPQVMWPAFDSDKFRKEFGPPKEDAIENLFFIAFKRIKPFLLRDLCSRLPDRIIAWDGTFSIAKKTMSDLLSEEDPDALGIIYDEYG